jgi:uncharacterized SAM-binding protein YcdF (DUF218 family)
VFFYISKLAAFFLAPLNSLAVLLLIALGCLLRGRVRAAKWLLGSTVAIVVVVTAFPVPQIAADSLERSFRPPADLPDKIDGILLLGGGQDLDLSHAHGRPSLNDDAETLTEFAALARRFPAAKLLFSGGSGTLAERPVSEADVVAMFFVQQGLDPRRLLLEAKSRDTHENAVFSRALARPQPGESWLLVTSALHMPRSVAVFRRIGWDVVPYPVSYRSMPDSRSTFDVARQFRLLDEVVHEWIGLWAYRVTGRI